MIRHMGTEEDRAKIKKLLKKACPSWQHERLIALKMGFEPHHSLDRIGEVVGRHRITIQRWFDRYRQEGLPGVLRRGLSTGAKSRCTKEVQQYLRAGLKAGRWNSAVQAHRALQEHFGRKYPYKTVWRWLKNCSGVMRVPRPVHEKRDPKQAEAFKRKGFWEQLQKLPLKADKGLRIWFADESRYGLQPVRRRCWTVKGHRPKMKYATGYQWSYCYGALEVVEGQAIFVQTPSVNLQWTEKFLEQIKKHYPEEEHVIVWDGAGFHPSESTHEKVPEGIHLITLPAYSPELNRIEKLWDIIQDTTANKLWPSIKRLDKAVGSLLKEWWQDPEKILSLVGEGWQHLQANASAN